MSIQNYSNIDNINLRKDTEGKILSDKELLIISKGEKEIIKFGENFDDLMEVSLYDINNNLLPQKSGNNVAYIKSGDIKNYIYNVSNKTGQQEIAINAEKLLNDLGFTNGIFKLNINFVRNKIGSENVLTRVWVQEISPSREEIRIIPLKTSNTIINAKTNRQFRNLKKLNKDFATVKSNILKSLDTFVSNAAIYTKIDDYIVAKFGKDYIPTLAKDFGISGPTFESKKKEIITNFQLSVKNYLSNKEWDILTTTFGKTITDTTKIFVDSEIYDTETILNTINVILSKCIEKAFKDIKVREIKLESLELQFQDAKLNIITQDSLGDFKIFEEKKVSTYTSTEFIFPSLLKIPLPPNTPAEGTILKNYCVGYDAWSTYADGKGGTYDSLVTKNSIGCGYTGGGSGGSGGGGGKSEGGTGGNGPGDGRRMR
jgi:uncharacterized membrane protein YgcG